jgi:hypothetical protein
MVASATFKCAAEILVLAVVAAEELAAVERIRARLVRQGSWN